MTTQAVIVFNASTGRYKQLTPNTTSAGSADAGKLVALNASGQLDITMMPTGVGAPTSSITASEALSAGAFVNVWNNASTQNVRNADGSTTGKEAHGFVLSAVASGATATVYFSGLNTALSGLTPGPVFLSDSTAGASTGTAPSTSGHTLQRIGVAISATTVDFQPTAPLDL